MKEIQSCGAGTGLIDVEKMTGRPYGFALYTNNSTATQAIQIVCLQISHDN